MGFLFAALDSGGGFSSAGDEDGFGGGGDWNSYGEGGTVVWFALDGYAAVVGFDDGFDEAEAEAEAALGTAFVAAVEAVPDLGDVLGGDAFAVVLGDDDDFGAGTVRGDAE